MESDSRKVPRVAVLNEEMDAIHCANNLFWKRGQAQTVAAKAEYQFRNDRLDEIRAELSRIQAMNR